MGNQPRGDPSVPVQRIPLLAVLVLIAAVYGCSIYANLAFAVKNKADYRYFPPFKPYVNANGNHHLGGEYFQMARALAAGEGFAHPFDRPTGPTAWQPPILPGILAGLLWLCDRSRDGVMAVVVCLQTTILIGTGLLVFALVRQTTTRLGAATALAIFLVALLGDFRVWFQFTHDCWLVLLAVDCLIAGLCWCRPFGSRLAAAGWGLCGGLFALINPIVGLTWAILSLVAAWRHRTWSRLAGALLCAGLALTPWTIRNYLVFGRLIPIKSNLAFELYQSQCLQPDGLLTKFILHPYRTNNPEGREYKARGEVAYLDRKREQFWQSVWADPAGFLDRAAYRLLAATVWYVPFSGAIEAGRPWALWARRLIHPLPFLALMILLWSGARAPLPWTHWSVIGVYLLYLLPYIGASYYERYAAPLLGVKVLLVIWAVDRLLSLCAPSRLDSGLRLRVVGGSAKPQAATQA
jgi:hypothetical protein